MRDIKYIIKRIIIGVGIALLLMYLKGGIALQVHAKTISAYNTTGYSEDINSGYSSVSFSVPGAPYKSHGTGVLRFSFGITKLSGSSTDPILVPRLVRAYNGSNTAYVCNFGSTANSNSTWTGQSYSVECPMTMDSNGLTEILVAFIPFSQNSTSTFRVSFPPDISYEYGDTYDNGSSAVNSEAQAQGNATRNTINNATQNIINNDNQNTQDIINSNKVCSQYDKNDYSEYGQLLNTGVITLPNNHNYGTTDFIRVDTNTQIVVSNSIAQSINACFFNVNKTLISCTLMNNFTGNLTVPNGAYYFRGTINLSQDKPTYTICRNGNQVIADGQQQINDTLNNDNVNGATSQAESFFDDFQSDSHGLSGVITAPLRLITSLSSSTCTSLSIPLPFVQTNATLPCMSTIYSTYFPTFLSLYQLITTGLIGYWVLIKIFGHVKGMQDPKDDRIEVLDL